MELHLTATGCHLPHRTTQCYLPPDTSEHTPVINDIIWQIGLIMNLTAYGSEMSYVYKKLFGMVDLNLNQYFTLSSCTRQCNSLPRVQMHINCVRVLCCDCCVYESWKHGLNKSQVACTNWRHCLVDRNDGGRVVWSALLPIIVHHRWCTVTTVL